MLDRQAIGGFYKDRREQVLAFSKALNEEYHRLADAGCAVIQIEEPCLHNSGGVEGEVPFAVYIEAFNQRSRACARRPRSGATPAGAIRSPNGWRSSRPTSRHCRISRNSMPTS